MKNKITIKNNQKLKKIIHWKVFIIVFIIFCLGIVSFYYLWNSQKNKRQSAQDLPILLNSKEKVAKDLDINLLEGTYVSISGTDLELKIPKKYDQVKKENDLFLGIVPVLSYKREVPQLARDAYECNQIESRGLELAPYINEEYCKPIVAKFDLGSDFAEFGFWMREGLNTFSVGIISTSLSSRQWAKQNVSYEGEKWNEAMGGKDIRINNFVFFSLQVGCCATYEQVYFHPYVNLDNQKIILAFITNDLYGRGTTEEELESERNIILDKIIATLRKNGKSNN